MRVSAHSRPCDASCARVAHWQPEAASAHRKDGTRSCLHRCDEMRGVLRGELTGLTELRNAATALFLTLILKITDCRPGTFAATLALFHSVSVHILYLSWVLSSKQGCFSPKVTTRILRSAVFARSQKFSASPGGHIGTDLKQCIFVHTIIWSKHGLLPKMQNVNM